MFLMRLWEQNCRESRWVGPRPQLPLTWETRTRREQVSQREARGAEWTQRKLSHLGVWEWSWDVRIWAVLLAGAFSGPQFPHLEKDDKLSTWGTGRTAQWI